MSPSSLSSSSSSFNYSFLSVKLRQPPYPCFSVFLFHFTFLFLFPLFTACSPLNSSRYPRPICARFYFSFMDMKRMDVSRFMLFEATGDSDAAVMDEQFALEDKDDDDDDDADAESCSHEGSETHNWDLGDQQLGGHKSDVADAESQHRDGNKNDDDETAVQGTSYCDDDEVQKRQHRSSLSVESGQQLVDEVEKNRRFWEACLAS